MKNSSNEPSKEHMIAPPGSGFEGANLTRALDAIGQWAQRYVGSLDERDVSEPIEPGAVLAQLEHNPPMKGMGQAGWASAIADVERIVEPGLVHWQSPRFFAYFPCQSSLAGVMGDLVASVLNVNGMLWSTSPSATELEMRMMDWCAGMFGLPDGFRFDRPGSIGGGCIQGTASEGVLSALVAARRRKVHRGADRSTMTIYTSTQAHSSVIKSAMVAGLADDPDDRSRVRLIEVDAQLTMDVDALERAILQDIADGLTPCLVSSTQGTTSTGAFDPLDAIGAMLARLPDAHRPWLHVDAAWAGAAGVCPEHRFVLGGVDRADSVCINPHKWLLTNFDCDLFWVKDRQALTDSMSITPAYLRDPQSESGAVVDYRDWHVPLGRRMRAIKLWFVIRYYGVEGLRAHIRSHIALAEVFAEFVRAEPRLDLVFDRSLGLVCFRVVGEDQRTKALIDRVNERRRVMISHTAVPIGDQAKPNWVARVAVGASGVGRKDIDELIGEISAVLDEVIE